MCLTISVEIENMDKKQAEEIADSIKGKGVLSVSVYTPIKWFKKLQPILIISEDMHLEKKAVEPEITVKNALSKVGGDETIQIEGKTTSELNKALEQLLKKNFISDFK